MLLVPTRRRIWTNRTESGLIFYFAIRTLPEVYKRLSNDYQRYLSNKKGARKERHINQFNYLITRYLLADATGIHHWISAAIHSKRYKSYSDNWTKSKRKCKVFTFNGFRSWSCTAFFQSFCEISSAMYKILIDKGFHRICYRTLDYFRKDNVFLVNPWLLLK